MNVWPTEPWVRPLETAFFIGGASLLASFLSRRLPSGWNSLRQTSFVRVLVLTLLGFAWAMLLFSAEMLLGVGTSNNLTCTVSVWGGMLLYGGNKLTIIMFLTERVCIVHAHSLQGKVKRFKSRWYRAALVCLAVWLIVWISDMFGRVSYTKPDGTCVLGLKIYASASLLTTEFLVNIFLTAAFVVPIYRSHFSAAQGLAKKSCIAAVGCFVSTTANLLTLTLMGGEQVSYVWLFGASLDVFCNSCIIHYITSTDQPTRDRFDHHIITVKSPTNSTNSNNNHNRSPTSATFSTPTLVDPMTTSAGPYHGVSVFQECFASNMNHTSISLESPHLARRSSERDRPVRQSNRRSSLGFPNRDLNDIESDGDEDEDKKDSESGEGGLKVHILPI